jgi:hypothetical protein
MRKRRASLGVTMICASAEESQKEGGRADKPQMAFDAVVVGTAMAPRLLTCQDKSEQNRPRRLGCL